MPISPSPQTPSRLLGSLRIAGARVGALVSLLAVSLGALPGCGSDEPASIDEGPPLTGITAAHNMVRAAVGVPDLVWNPELAGLAAGFIEDCQFEHSSQSERSNVAGFGYVGENLYAASGLAISGQGVSDAWASEKPDYDYPSNSCAGGKVCGHYTQQVWKTTTDLGCAAKACGNTVIVACEYGPGGNYVGEKPY